VEGVGYDENITGDVVCPVHHTGRTASRACLCVGTRRDYQTAPWWRMPAGRVSAGLCRRARTRLLACRGHAHGRLPPDYEVQATDDAGMPSAHGPVRTGHLRTATTLPSTRMWPHNVLPSAQAAGGVVLIERPEGEPTVSPLARAGPCRPSKPCQVVCVHSPRVP
jgi:hypothetical protein